MDEVTYSGDPNLNPKNSNNVSKLVMLIKSALFRSIAPKISYPPASHKTSVSVEEMYGENRQEGGGSRILSISSEFCQLNFSPSVNMPSVLDNSCEVCTNRPSPTINTHRYRSQH